MALKLGKCRLCLKLGDFYSIFTVDNAIQLAEMVMECARVKIYDGDGLPDKICSECIQKLSSAYIFKQQCERSDQELRRNYVPPPGFSITPPPPQNRQSSDSAFSSQTDISNQTKPSSSNESAVTPASRSRKRSRESADNTSVSSRSHDYAPATKRVSELRDSQKKRRVQNSYEDDSDYEDHMSNSQFSAGTDSDEPLLKNSFKCKKCEKSFASAKSLALHSRTHKKDSLGQNEVVNIPKPAPSEDATDDDDKLSCDKCGKTFKLKIMLKRHHDLCGVIAEVSPQKELLVSLEPIDAPVHPKKIECEICTSKFKSIDNLNKHLRVVHAAAPKPDPSPVKDKKVSVPCIFCRKQFDDYYVYTAHHNSCNKRRELDAFSCPVCKRLSGKRSAFFVHVKNLHFERGLSGKEEPRAEAFDCRVCSKRLASQEQLITHLAAHMSHIDEPEAAADDESRASTLDDSASIASADYTSSKYVSNGPLKCGICDKRFTYKKALVTHHERCHANMELQVKVEPPDKMPEQDNPNLLSETRAPSESESSDEEGDDNTCDICEKHFSYKRLLLQHKRTKHNLSSGTKRAKITLKDCSVRCLICDLEMKVSAINEHNQKHISVNIKPRNVYTCAECQDKFKSCSALAGHIKFVHRLKQPRAPKAPRALEGGSELADFCEVVVTKAEPLDALQDHNDPGAVPPSVSAAGFTCPLCTKRMPTLLALKRHVNWHTYRGKDLEKNIECAVCKEVSC